LPAETEADVYRHLGLPYIPPELREGQGEIEAARAGTLPDDLLAAEDVRGFVHCHTVYSDGRHTIEEMARAADGLGMEYLTITDHSPTASYAGGLTVDRLRTQWDEIARVQESVSVRLLRGTESDILASGALDYPDAVLEQLDIVIASVHARYRMDADRMTERLRRAMSLPCFKVWGHALGRLLLSRPPIECRVEEVLDTVQSARAAVEINGDPRRLDLAPRWIPAARARGIPFVVSTDAHSVGELANLRYGVAMARRGGVRRGEVLNTLGATAFARAVAPAGRG
jgi:DNA polymerase (family X)